jgi:hypothetical protein
MGLPWGDNQFFIFLVQEFNKDTMYPPSFSPATQEYRACTLPFLSDQPLPNGDRQLAISASASGAVKDPSTHATQSTPVDWGVSFSY